MASILETVSLSRRSSAITMDQVKALEAVERSMSVFSVLGCLFIITTFTLCKDLKRKAFNRLLFFASFGNIFSNVATLIATSGVKAGDHSGLCKVQATLIQWFMPADCLWTFCMACNVFLTFQTTKLRVNLQSLEKYYIALCFGIPAIPALTYLFLDVSRGTDYYGNAVLWCWINKNHDKLRIVTFYAPVWVIILVTMTLYGVTGRSVYKGQARNRTFGKAMRNDSSDSYDLNTVTSVVSCELGSLTKCTEISQTSEPRKPSCYAQSNGSTVNDVRSSISSSRKPKRSSSNLIHVSRCTDVKDTATNADHAPRSSNRPVNKITTTVTTLPVVTSCSKAYSPPPETPRHVSKTNRGARAYAQVAFLLYVVMLVVWVPSTINRVYGLAEHNKANFGLNLAAAIVLPLQGFFNTCIYLFTSRREMCRMYHEFRARLKADKLPINEPRPSAMNNFAADILTRPATAKMNARNASTDDFPSPPINIREMLLSLEDRDDDVANFMNYPWRQNSIASHAVEKPVLDV